MKIIIFESFEEKFHKAIFIDLSLVDENNSDQVTYKDNVLTAMKNNNLGPVSIYNCFTNGNKELDDIRIDVVPELFDENDKIVTLFVV